MNELTPQEKASAQAKCNAINANGAVLKECDSLTHLAVRSSRPAAQRMLILRDVSDRMSKLIAPHTPCRIGCAQCCRQAVTISQEEADWITAYTGRANVPQPDLSTPAAALAAVERMHADRARYVGNPCPFLKDEICSVYSARPTACRAHHSLADTPDNCDTAHPERRVPWYDMQPLHFAVAEVTGTLADIRDYFPEAGK